MSGEATVSTPGKTILFGEHAAVYGCPALVTALDHRMTVTAKASATAKGASLHLTIPSLQIARTVSWADVATPPKQPGDLALLAATLGTEGSGRRPSRFDLRIDSAIPSGSGFGSSAALAVGVVAACRRACGDEIGDDEIARLAISIERHQHGVASGVDVQAVLRGGVLWCRRSDDGTLEHVGLKGADSCLDAFRLFHSGSPNETTGEMVASVRRRLAEEPRRAGEAFLAIEAAAEEGRSALLRDDRGALVSIVRRAEAALESIGVVPDQVSGAIRSIESDGGAAKISGAGGMTGAGAGLVLVVHSDAEWHKRFRPPPGWTAHPVRLGAEGLRSEIAA